jgi:hypothetical protein
MVRTVRTKTIIGAATMTLAAFSATVFSVFFIFGFFLHRAFEAYRNQTRYIKNASYREAALLSLNMPAHGGSHPARGQASQMGQGAIFKFCINCGQPTFEVIEWGIVFDRCAKHGLVEVSRVL